MQSSRNGHVGHDLNFSEDDPRPLFYVQDPMPSSTMVVLSFPTIQSQVRINLLQLHENMVTCLESMDGYGYLQSLCLGNINAENCLALSWTCDGQSHDQ